MASNQEGKSYFLNPVKGQYGTYYSNKDKKNRGGAPEINVYPTSNDGVLKIDINGGEKFLAGKPKNKDVDYFICSDILQDEIVFIRHGENDKGEYMRVGILPKRKEQVGSAPAAKPEPARPAASGSKFGSKTFKR